MEILLPSTGSRPIAGANGSEARSASSCGVGGGGASGDVTSTFAFGAGPSSVSTGGGSRTAGWGGVESIVWMSVAFTVRWARGAARWQLATATQQSAMAIRFIRTTLSADDVPVFHNSAINLRRHSV